MSHGAAAALQTAANVCLQVSEGKSHEEVQGEHGWSNPQMGGGGIQKELQGGFVIQGKSKGRGICVAEQKATVWLVVLPDTLCSHMAYLRTQHVSIEGNMYWFSFPNFLIGPKKYSQEHHRN